MECPKCADDSVVLTCVKANGKVYRKRRCKVCSYTFFSEETESKDYEAIEEINKRYAEYARYRRKGVKMNG